MGRNTLICVWLAVALVFVLGVAYLPRSWHPHVGEGAYLYVNLAVVASDNIRSDDSLYSLVVSSSEMKQIWALTRSSRSA